MLGPRWELSACSWWLQGRRSDQWFNLCPCDRETPRPGPASWALLHAWTLGIGRIRIPCGKSGHREHIHPRQT